MKLAIVTPFVQRSAIGRVNAAVADQLAARGHDVQIIRSESIDDPQAPLHRTTLPCRHWSKVDLVALARQVDLAIVNVGDNYLFHGGIFPVLEQVPSLGVFHDFYIYNLFSGWLYDKQLDWKAHDGEIETVYGPEALDAARAARSGELDMGGIAQVIPMTEWVARRCAGALSHADFYRQRLEAVCAGPVGMIPLCGPARPGGPVPARKRKELVIVTLGVMNPNKCAADVILAIAASDSLRDIVRYRLVGEISDSERERLTSLANELGFTGLSIEGAVDDVAFEAAMADADVITCLRRPVLEGASGSVIDGMLSGRPTIVCDAGFYGEQPDDLVCKIAPQVDVEELTATLERLAADPTTRREMGKKARAYALDALGPERYAEGLEAAALQTLDALPLLAVGERVGWRLSQMGLGKDHLSVQRIASSLTRLFQ